MKLLRSARTAGLATVVALATCAAALTSCVVEESFAAEAAPTVAPPTFDVFYRELSPHGRWIEHPTYGWVWKPSVDEVGVEFVPYATHGHWVHTDLGWSFECDLPWAWAPFHYGRWVHAPTEGWVWIPGYEWAPAWVEWRIGGGYIGWGPLGPPGIVVAESDWVFVEERFFTRPRVYVHAVPVWRRREVFAVTTPLRTMAVYVGARWYAGPTVAHVAVATGHPIRTLRVSPAPRMGRPRGLQAPRGMAWR